MKKIVNCLFGLVLMPLFFASTLNAEETKKIGGVKITAKEYSKGTVYIGKGEVHHGDIVVKGNPVTIDGVLDGDLTSFGGMVTVNGTVKGNVASIGGPASIKGKVEGEVVILGSPLEMEGSAGENVVSVGGPVNLKNSALIKGDVTTLGGTLDKTEKSHIMGDIVNLEGKLFGLVPKITKKIIAGIDRDEKFDRHNRYKHWRDYWKHKYRHKHSFTGFIFYIFALAGLGLIVFLSAVIMPKHIEVMSDAVRLNFWRSLGIGLLISVLILPVSVGLAVSIVGIPLIPLFLFAVFACLFVCMAVFSLVLARRFAISFKKSEPSVFSGVIYGYIILVALFVLSAVLKRAGGFLSGIGELFAFVNVVLISVAIVTGFGVMFITKLGTKSQEIITPKKEGKK